MHRNIAVTGYRRYMTVLGRTDLDVFRICLGGNVFGWTADEPQSHAILDAYAGAGGNFIDTANSYLVEHGRSETIIGRWIASRKNREEIVLATKVGGGRGAVALERVGSEAPHVDVERTQRGGVRALALGVRGTGEEPSAPGGVPSWGWSWARA